MILFAFSRTPFQRDFNSKQEDKNEPAQTTQPSIRLVRQAKTQIKLRIRAV